MNRATIHQIIKEAGYQTVSLGFYAKIREWERWYRGKVSAFHNYEVFLAKGQATKVEMQSLGMGKKICEDWADLLYNEKTFIVLDDGEGQKIFDEALRDNNFEVLGNELVEKAFMAGTGAFVLRIDKKGQSSSGLSPEGKIRIDYVSGDMIFPLEWENGRVEGCAFGSAVVRDGKKYFYLQAHERKDGKYIVSNRFYPIDKNSGNISVVAVELPDVESETTYETEKPLFTLIKPNIANNIEWNNPMGISVYANAIDQIKACDIAFDGASVAMKVGRPRIAISAEAVKTDEEGNVIPIVDTRDVALYSVPARFGDNKTLVEDITTSYRANEYMTTLEKNLLLLSQKVGFGERAYSFENGSVATATQVIAENSKMFRTMKKHQKILTQAFRELAEGILFLNGFNKEVTVTVNYDDSIIEDTGARKGQMLAEVQAGIANKWEYRMEFYGEDEETAKKKEPQREEEGYYDFIGEKNNA
jgi:A118 family predicted phage portal protein